MVNLLFTKESFTREVEHIARKDNLSYAESIVEVCDSRDLDVRDIKMLISAPLKDKLENEAKDRNVIKSERVTKTAFFSIFSE